MACRLQNVPVVRPYFLNFLKSRHPRRNQVNHIAGPDEYSARQQPQGLVHFPQQGFGEWNQVPRPQLDVGTKGRCKRSRLRAGQLPFPITAMNGAGYFGNAQGRGVQRDGRPDKIADQFGIRIVEIALCKRKRNRSSTSALVAAFGNDLSAVVAKSGNRFMAFQCATGKPGANSRAGLISATGTPLFSITTTSPDATRSTTNPVRRCNSRTLTRMSHIVSDWREQRNPDAHRRAAMRISRASRPL